MYFLMVAAKTYWIMTLILVYSSKAEVRGFLSWEDTMFELLISLLSRDIRLYCIGGTKNRKLILINQVLYAQNP